MRTISWRSPVFSTTPGRSRRAICSSPSPDCQTDGHKYIEKAAAERRGLHRVRAEAGNGYPVCAGPGRARGAGRAGRELVRPSGRFHVHDRHYRHERQDHKHISSEAHSGKDRRREGRPHRHDPEYDRRRSVLHTERTTPEGIELQAALSPRWRKRAARTSSWRSRPTRWCCTGWIRSASPSASSRT